MRDHLEETKEKLDRKFLGRAGIHGVGLRRTKQAVTVYMSPDAADRETTIRELKKQAAPFDVIVVEDDMPLAKPAASGQAKR